MTKSELAESLDEESSDEAGHSCSRAETEGAFMDFGDGFITGAYLRLEVMDMGVRTMKCPTWSA